MRQEVYINRANPLLFMVMLDQSLSMKEPFAGEGSKRKADRLAEIVNKHLINLVMRCSKPEGVLDYCRVAILGYSEHAAPAFEGQLKGRELVPLSELAHCPLRVDQKQRKVDDGAGGFITQREDFPVWIDPMTKSGTSMSEAFRVAIEIVKRYMNDHPDSFPPIVVNITDGESTDGDPTSQMKQLTALESRAGNPLLFNIHVSSQPGSPIEFPDTAEGLPDEYSELLFDTAGELTPLMRAVALREYDLKLPEGSRAFVFNSDSALVIQALNLGSVTIGLDRSLLDDHVAVR